MLKAKTIIWLWSLLAALHVPALGEEAAAEERLCIAEKHVILSEVSMAPPSAFTEETLAACISYCLTRHPGKSYALISLLDAAFIGDQFNCLCASKNAFREAPPVSKLKCDIRCPDQQDKRCGDAKSNMLSVYCLRRSCHTPVNDTPLCHQRRPHDNHGCLASSFIDWTHAHNVRNFTDSGTDSNTPETGLVPDATDCVWECKDKHDGAKYSLTRKVGGELMCSCGYDDAFDSSEVAASEFCAMLPPPEMKDSERMHYYTVNCVGDLDQGAATTGKPEKTCSGEEQYGCIYEELVANQSYIKISGLALPSPSVCQRACAASFSNLAQVGVRWDEDDLHCRCLPANAYEDAAKGPDMACNTTCTNGAEALCGGTDPQPALSLYCAFPDEDLPVQNQLLSPLMSSEGISLLKSIHLALHRGGTLTDVMVALITLLCILMASIVTYLCYTRGISSLSRQVM